LGAKTDEVELQLTLPILLKAKLYVLPEVIRNGPDPRLLMNRESALTAWKAVARRRAERMRLRI
jgi:hypothetical protein